eukprot:TRINITY_DN346_c0_g1_i7.p1 TRINITY_DN346_c0_g1~~TRINITY_DN346_c0_g1_i7.p1  ORF type:complete len:725 (-),score=160.42 TRINITY_DN346_c0_g1_i7:1141-3315(-)
MSRRPKSSQSVALFPFLAVLVCTMGALIFLLLVTTRMISDQAKAEAVAEATPAPQLPLMNIATAESLAPPSSPPAVASEPEEPAEPTIDIRAAAVAQRQRELESLNAQWQAKVDGLTTAREDRVRLLSQRQQLSKVASQRVAAMQVELKDLEIKLGRMTGELSASAVDVGTAKERIELETQIKELKRRLRAAQQSSGEDKFEVVPFDIVTGTSRRPILIECTATGLRFIPEDIKVTPEDLMGFTPQVNPLVVGASALVNYWTAWNIRQPNPSREPEPYVLLLVRPSGTIAYYVAMKMMSDLKQPHGYELIEEDTVLQMPPVDAGAKTACETAIKRLLAERNQTLRQAGAAGFGLGRGRIGGGSGGGPGIGNSAVPGGGSGAVATSGSATGGSKGSRPDGTRGTGGAAGASPGAEEFELADIIDKQESGSRVWERVENFEGSKRGVNGGSPGSSPSGSQGGKAAANQGQAGAPRTGGRDAPGGGSGSSRQMVTASASPGQQGMPSKPGSVPNSSGSSEVSGIEQLEEGAEAEASEEGESGGFRPDIGLGSSGKRSIPVEDHRSKKHKASDRDTPSTPEQLASRHWGISEPGAAIGLEREIRIDVEPNRYVIGKKHGVPLVDSDSREDTFVKVVSVIDLQARDWGKPPQGFFWKPSVRFVIADGGDANFERIQSLFERAGLSTSREYPHDHPPEKTETAKAPAPATHTPAPATPKTSRRLFRGIMR